MAKAATDEQIQLRRRARRRLIGALALVTLIAVVLPWILESEPRQSDQEISIQIPSSSDSGTFSARVAPGKIRETSEAKGKAKNPATAGPGEGAKSAGSGTSEQGTVHPSALPERAAATRQPKPTNQPNSPATEAKKKASEHQERTAGDKQFVVQIAALNDAAKAIAMQKALAAKGHKSYTEVVKTASGDVTRVRVGPFPNRDSAERERVKLNALGFNGNVTPR